jgi:pantetheine-phosphate adenylyltransferase
MSRAVCPGTFDPVHHGHLDVIARAARLFDEVVVAVGVNPSKNRLFGDDERIAMLERACADLPGVRVVGFTGLLTDLCAELDAQALVKGLRGAGDFEYEAQMAGMNARQTGVDTVFLPTDPRWSFVASSLVKEVAGLGGDVAGLLPDFVHTALLARLAERASRTGP